MDIFGLFGYFVTGGSPTFIWPWEGSNYPSRSCNGPNGPKGPKFKQNKNKQHGGMRRNQIQCKQWESMEIISRIYICQDNEKKTLLVLTRKKAFNDNFCFHKYFNLLLI